MPQISLLALGISLLATWVAASPAQLVPAIRIDQTLYRRADFAGGWPLAASACPSDTILCNKGLASQVNPACCPTGTICAGTLVRPFCCPTNADCGTEAHNFPICAGKDQVMYQLGGNDFFCCKQDQIGMTPLSGFTGICRNKNSPPAESLLATQAPQYGATAVGPNPTATNDPAASTAGAGGASNTAGAGSGTNTAAPPGANPTTIINNNGGGSSSSSSSSSSSAASSSSASLSTGAIAGIAVGGVAIIAIVIVLGWFVRSGRFHGLHHGAKPDAPPAEYKSEGPKDVYTSGSPVQSNQGFVGGHQSTAGAGPQEWKSPVSQHTDLGSTTAANSVVSPLSPPPGRSELSL